MRIREKCGIMHSYKLPEAGHGKVTYMNETVKHILSRRSTRAFLPAQIKEEELQTLLQAACFAPSAHNDQPWHFTVVQDQALLMEVNLAAKTIGKHSRDAILRKMSASERLHIFYQAPTVIFVAGEKSALMPETDCAAAVENMLVAAEAMGIGSCWIGLASFAFDGEQSEALCKKLLIPASYQPLYAVSFGYKKIEAVSALPRRENTIAYVR